MSYDRIMFGGTLTEAEAYCRQFSCQTVPKKKKKKISVSDIHIVQTKPALNTCVQSEPKWR